MAPVIIAAAPNGARLTKADHPALPLSPRELAAEAKACLEAGAAMIHLHVRDAQGAHTLDAGAYNEAGDAIRQAVGRALVIQMTSESAGRFTPAQQWAAIAAARPEQASLALREVAPSPADEDRALAHIADCAAWGVSLQFIAYDAGDLARLARLEAAGSIGGPISVLVVLGRGRTPPQALSEDRVLLDQAPKAWTRMVCAFGAVEHEIALGAALAGTHVRVGFENNRIAPDGTPAASTAAQIAALSRRLRLMGARLGVAADWRALHAAKGA